MIASIQKAKAATTVVMVEDLVDKIMLDSPVDKLEVSVRTYNCLREGNIRTVRDLVQKTPAEMLKIKNFGRYSLNEIKEVLAPMGFFLGMKIDEHGNAINKSDEEDTE